MLARARVGRFAGYCSLGCLLFFVLATPAGAAGSAPTTSGGGSTTDSSTSTVKPSLTFVGPSAETISMVPVAGHSGLYRGQVALLLQNAGDQVVQAGLAVTGDPTAAGPPPQLVGSSGTFPLAAFQVTKRVVTITDKDSSDNNVTFVLTAKKPSGVGPATETFKLLRAPVAWYFWIPVFVGLGFAVVFLVVRGLFWWLEIKRRHTRMSKSKAWERYGKRPVYPPSAWTFGGSWVTVISVLGAALATVLGTSGLIADAFPGIDVQRFVVLNLLLGGVVLTGPLIYTANSRVDVATINGRAYGLWLAASVTLIGVAGQLSTLGELAWLSNGAILQKFGIVVVIAFAGVVLFWYSFQSVDQLVRLPRPATPQTPPTTVTGI